MKKFLSLILWVSLTTLSQSYAIENGGPVTLYDSVGNGLQSTSGALNVSFGMSTFAVTQSTSPWITKDLSDGSVTGGTAGTFSLLGGGIFNTALPTLTNGNQAAFQLDGSARLYTAAVQSGAWSVTANIGTTGGLALDASVTALQVAQGSTTSGQKGDLVLGAVTTSAPSYTNATSNPLSITLAGGLRVDGSGSTQPISGNVNAIPADGVKSAYSAVITNVVPASAATDLFTIIGSATKIVRIRNLALFGSQTVGSAVPFIVIKRSTADTGGTSTTGTAVPWSSADAAATAVVSGYTANPSALGTSLGSLSYEIPFLPIVKDQLFEYNFNLTPSQVYTLNSAAETIAINLNAATITGGSITLKMSWTEE